ncbi:hypothetical protein NQ318_007686 [Aromia moschata]|uniref:Nuclear pore complex protein Nup85 n=1 Tax=Aromia moschata TaxID=1265417 RepID=A0AAV8XK51_9CUCU|nr:hypothetical protein NQ318_007686 [Aromia moschata]
MSQLNEKSICENKPLTGTVSRPNRGKRGEITEDAELSEGEIRGVRVYVVIPNHLCRRAGIAATWIPIDQIAIFPYEKKHMKQKDCPSQFASQSVTSVFHLRHSVILFHPILRKLVNESFGVFVSLQNLSANKPIEHRLELLKLSRQYRSIIRACLENLQEEITNSVSDNADELKNYVTILYSIECIWHLCEILLIDVGPGNIILPYLLEWVRFHFPKYERNAATLFGGDLIGLESHPEFWDTIIGLLLQGRINIVRALLRQHSASDSNTFKLVDRVLRAMPVYDVTTGTPINEFIIQRQHWLIDVQAKIDAKLFVSDINLNMIMKLVVGDEETWAGIQRTRETWYEFLAGWLFFTEPTVKPFELGEFAKNSIEKMKMKNRLKQLDKAILAVLEYDLLQVINEIQSMTDNGWFVSHLTDLLYHSGRLSNLEQEISSFSAKNLRESFVLNYGITLMGHKSLWQIGLSYLDHCPNNGIHAIELLLPRIPLENEAKTKKIVYEAKQRNLNHIAQSVSKAQGVISMNHGRLGNALTWALRSQDGPFTSFLADKFLKEYIKSGTLVSSDILEHLGSWILASDRLIFLGKFYEFHKLYQDKDYRGAANILTSLLSSKIIPKYFWSVLLLDTIPLLESEELVFSSNDTFTIMHCVEEKENLPELKDKVEIIRLAAARNLSRALIFEAQLP